LLGKIESVLDWEVISEDFNVLKVNMDKGYVQITLTAERAGFLEARLCERLLLRKAK
jgi:hypothetical protein